MQQNQDEIDFEFLNGANGIPTWHVGSMWTNIFVAGAPIQHKLVEPTDLASLTEQPSFKTHSDYHHYVIDWQAGYIRWYVDGQLADQRLGADYKIPSKPQVRGAVRRRSRPGGL